MATKTVTKDKQRSSFYYRTRYECVDRAGETLPDSAADEPYSAAMFHVGIGCPLSDKRSCSKERTKEMSCVICTK